MYARSTTIEAQPSSIDAGITYVRDVVMPDLQKFGGCLGVSLLVDRGSGRCIATSSWQDEQGMRAGARAIRPMRDQMAHTFGGSPTVDEWEIAVLHRDHRSGPGAGVRATWLTVRPSLRAIRTSSGWASASRLAVSSEKPWYTTPFSRQNARISRSQPRPA